MHTKKYSNPPLVEAICTFQFAPSAPWDATILGLVYDRLKREFPVKAQAPGFQISFTSGGTPPIGAERMQFRKADNSALVQVSPDTLTVNHLTPYGGWPQFQAMIQNVLATYREVAAPSGLNGISLRYINRLFVPASLAEGETGGVEIGNYLRTHPVVPDSIPQVFLDWAQRVVVPFAETQQAIVMQAGTAPASEDSHLVFLLDLDARPLDGQTALLANMTSWLEDAHMNVETVFESCLGPKARLLFGEEPSSEAVVSAADLKEASDEL